jgi:ribosomal protein S18 acetylase RimI-like enzyme
MGIELRAEPEAPVWPAGITPRTFERGRDERAVFAAVEEAFQDHWGYVPRRFEEWRQRLDRSTFDPALWFLALDGEQIAGVALGWQRSDTGWVQSLAVRRPWRSRGLASALLRQAFRAFWARGERRVGLGVDSQNLTGAVRIYERAGMHAVEQAALYEKELRSGVDLCTREMEA